MRHKEISSVFRMTRRSENPKKNIGDHHAIRVFDIDDVYHVLMYDYTTDIAYLANEDCLEKNAELLQFHPNCSVTLPDGQVIGRSYLSNNNLRWVFEFTKPGFNLISVSNSHPEAIFDLEVEVSKEFVLLTRTRSSPFK